MRSSYGKSNSSAIAGAFAICANYISDVFDPNSTNNSGANPGRLRRR